MPIQLTAEELQDLRDMDKGLAEIKTEIARAKRAGLPVDELEARYQDAERLRRGLVREYGGGTVRQRGG